MHEFNGIAKNGAPIEQPEQDAVDLAEPAPGPAATTFPQPTNPRPRNRKRPVVPIHERTLFTSTEAASLLNCHSSSVNKWTCEGYLDCYKTPGGHRRYNRQTLINFAARFPGLAADTLSVLRPTEGELAAAQSRAHLLEADAKVAAEMRLPPGLRDTANEE